MPAIGIAKSPKRSPNAVYTLHAKKPAFNGDRR